MNLLLENVGTFVSHEIVPALVLKTELAGALAQQLLDKVVLVACEVEFWVHHLNLA